MCGDGANDCGVSYINSLCVSCLPSPSMFPAIVWCELCCVMCFTPTLDMFSTPCSKWIIICFAGTSDQRGLEWLDKQFY